MADDLASALAEAEKILARHRRVAALVTVAIVVAVVVLVLDYMIKQSIMHQIREADQVISRGSGGPHEHAGTPGFPTRGGDTMPDAHPVGRGGMVAGSPLAEGASPGGVQVPGSLSARRGGPPPSTDSDGGGIAGGPAGNSGLALPPDISAHPPE
jgi:hypothetical protein